MENMMTRACLRYTRDYLTPDMYSLIKPADMDNLMPYPAQIYTVML